MMVKHWRLLAVACGLSAVTASHAVCPFNVSGDAATDSLRDGVLLVRYAQGLRGAPLVAGTSATAATVETFLSTPANVAQLDVNGNGVFDIGDAAIIARNVFGFGYQSWMPDGQAGAYASRTSAALVKVFIDAGCTAPVFTGATAADYDASRFLIQSTFGPSRADVASFVALGADQATRRTAWINNQFALPRSGEHFQYLVTRKAEYVAGGAPDYTFGNNITRESFWGQALRSPDQLRQRLALALSEVLVVSEYGGSNDPYELAAYLDLLGENAFTNYRDLLYKVALSPAMGRYLSHLRNEGSSTNPNENFAREILQLFGVGLFRLNMDGTKTISDGSAGLPPAGQFIPTYDESMVKGFARVFTGFAYDDLYCKGVFPVPSSCTDSTGGVHPNWYWEPGRDDLGATFPPDINGWKRPMVPYIGRHNTLTKQLLSYNYTTPVNAGTAASACTSAVALASSGGVLPAPTPIPAIDEVTGVVIPVSGGGTRTNRTQAYATLNAAIDNIFCHPNVGPFVSKHLIRFFVTSTPSDAYVSRVTAAFNNTGGVRGDMKAVIRAVLTDSEATLAGATDPTKFGKLKEPMLRLSAIFRAFNTQSYSGRYRIDGLDSLEYGISQGPLQSPTVFNYFHPEFAPPGPIASANAIGPEFEITTTTAIAATQNYFGNIVARSDGTSSNAFISNLTGNYGCNIGVVSVTDPSANSRQNCMFGNLEELYTVNADASVMFDYINLVLLGGSLSSTNKANLVTALNTAYAPCLTAAACTGATTNAQWQDRKRNRVKAALWLAVHTPEFQIQR